MTEGVDVVVCLVIIGASVLGAIVTLFKAADAGPDDHVDD